MNLITLSLLQNSPEWHAHRATHYNASDAPAMLGISKYKSRAQLLKEMATGITPDVDAHTQRLFDKGHRYEALARPLAEQIIGDDLSPTVGSEGKLSASFDGITFDDSVIFEHKSLNADLRAALTSGTIPAQYCAQMEQQLMISGAEKCLFMCSRWDDDDHLIEELHQWYYSDQALRDNIIKEWNQFAIDLANYQHVEAAPEVLATPTRDLPALSIQVRGSISLIDNLAVFGAQLKTFVAEINMSPSDDQGFADAEAAVKTLQAAQDALEQAEASALAQTSSIDEMRKTVKFYADTARTARLMLEKMVKARKESIRVEIVQEAKELFTSYCKALEVEIKPIALMQNMPAFAEAIKGKRTISSLHESVDNVLRKAKMDADSIAKDVRAKLAWYKEAGAGFGFLFSDLQTIIYKPMDDFQLVVSSRIAAHAQKIIDDAAAKARAEQDAIRAQMEAAARVKAQDEAAVQREAERTERERMNSIAIEENRKQVQLADQAIPSRIATVTTIKPRLQSRVIINNMAENYGISYGDACNWIISIAQELQESA